MRPSQRNAPPPSDHSSEPEFCQQEKVKAEGVGGAEKRVGRGSTSEYLKIREGCCTGPVGVWPRGSGVSHIWAASIPSTPLAPSRQCPEEAVSRSVGSTPTKDPAGAGTPSQKNLSPGPYQPPPSTPLLHSTSVLDHQYSSSLLDSWGAQGCRTGSGERGPRALCNLADSLLLQAAFLCP